MNLILSIISILFVFWATFLFFKVVGQRATGLVCSRDDHKKWFSDFGRTFGSVLTITNILGTLTSLATAYLFFIGNSKLFGYLSLICCFTLLLGGLVSNWMTNQILKCPRTRKILEKKDQSGAVVCSLFWGENRRSKATSLLVKYVSICSLAAIVWLEFALFSDLTASIMGFNSLGSKVIISFISSLCVVYFVFKNGLRGFVFADILHSLLIGVAVLGLLVGAIYCTFFTGRFSLKDFWPAWRPMLSVKDCVLFGFHVLAINSFLVVLSESHWLRLWVFEKKEVNLQIRSQLATSAVWLVLIIIGILSWMITGKLGDHGVAALIQELGNLSPVFLVLFWLGAVAALFSTSDTQLYCFLLVSAFRNREGTIIDRRFKVQFPAISALFSALGIAFVYFLIRYNALPFEKIIFALMPATLNILPALFALAIKRRPSPFLLIASILGYCGCSLFGLLQPDNQMSATLAAALIPIFISGFVFLQPKHVLQDEEKN